MFPGKGRGGPKKKPIPLLAALVVPYVLLSLTLSILIGYMFYTDGMEAARGITGRLQEEINGRITLQMEQYLSAPLRITTMNWKLARSGTLPLEDQKALETRFLRQLQMSPTVTSVYFGNPDGGLANVGREPNQEKFYRLSTENFLPGAMTKRYITEDGEPLEAAFRVENFDARPRPWYTAALGSDEAVWGDPYLLATEDDFSLSVSRQLADPSGAFLGVISVDLTLSHLNSFLANLSVGPQGRAAAEERGGLQGQAAERQAGRASGLQGRASGFSFILDGQGRLLASSKTYRREGGQLVPLEQISDPTIQKAIEAARRTESGGSKGQLCRFSFEGESYSVLSHTLEGENHPAWTIITVLPESDLTGNLEGNLLASLGLMLLALTAALLVGILLARSIVAPISYLSSLVSRTGDTLSVRSQKISGKIHLLREVSLLYDAFTDFTCRIDETLASLHKEIEERKEAEKKVSALLKEKELLLGEVHHRVKNNMMLIKSLLSLQADATAEPKAAAVLEEGVRKIAVMAEAYEMMDQSDHYSSIPLRPLLESILTSLNFDSLKGCALRVHQEIEELHLPTKMAIHIGIMANELLTNCRKYAWPEECRGGQGEVYLRLKVLQESKLLELEVSDNGVGLPGSPGSPESRGSSGSPQTAPGAVQKRGSGLNIVEALALQYNGTLSLHSDKGLTVRITLPLPE